MRYEINETFNVLPPEVGATGFSAYNRHFGYSGFSGNYAVNPYPQLSNAGVWLGVSGFSGCYNIVSPATGSISDTAGFTDTTNSPYTKIVFNTGTNIASQSIQFGLYAANGNDNCYLYYQPDPTSDSYCGNWVFVITRATEVQVIQTQIAVLTSHEYTLEVMLDSARRPYATIDGHGIVHQGTVPAMTNSISLKPKLITTGVNTAINGKYLNNIVVESMAVSRS